MSLFTVFLTLVFEDCAYMVAGLNLSAGFAVLWCGYLSSEGEDGEDSLTLAFICKTVWAGMAPHC